MIATPEDLFMWLFWAKNELWSNLRAWSMSFQKIGFEGRGMPLSCCMKYCNLCFFTYVGNYEWQIGSRKSKAPPADLGRA